MTIKARPAKYVSAEVADRLRKQLVDTELERMKYVRLWHEASDQLEEARRSVTTTRIEWVIVGVLSIIALVLVSLPVLC